MTPRPHCDDRPQQNSSRHRNVHFKNRHHQYHCKRAVSQTRSQPDTQNSAKAPPENYENLLLLYLTKLKNLFSNPHPQPAGRENSAIKMNKLHHEPELKPQRPSSCQHPYRYTSSNPPKPREEDVRAKVYKVVSAALQYGFANNVLERKGDYFMLKNHRFSKLHARAPTPGPRYCGRCCNIHKHLESDLRCGGAKRAPSPGRFERSLHSIGHGKVEKRLICPRHGRKVSNRSLSGLKINVNHCPQCRALERRL